MKTSQGSEALSSGKKVNEVQEILDFTRNFIDSHGRFPKLRELPAKIGYTKILKMQAEEILASLC